MAHKPPKERLRRLYYDEGLTQAQIADKIGEGVYQAKVSEWMRSFGIGPGKRVDLAADACRVNRATYRSQRAGYENWHARYQDRMERVAVHRLAAVAWFGFNAVRDKDVHHVNGVPWDNRESNLALLSPGEHRSRHADEMERSDLGRFVSKGGHDLAGKGSDGGTNRGYSGP